MKIQKIWLIIFCINLFFIILPSGQENVDSSDKLSSIKEKYGTTAISSFCNLVYKRYYLIVRMKKAIEMLYEIDRKAKKNKKYLEEQDKKRSILTINESFFFKHHDIKDCIEKLNNTGRFKSLFKLWNDLSEYKKIDDAEFSEEFIRLIFIILKDFVISFHVSEKIKSVNDPSTILSDLNYTNSSTILDIMNNLVKHSPENKMSQNVFSKIIDESEIFRNLNPELSETELVTYRFFYIHRLIKPISLLEKIKEKNFYAKNQSDKPVRSIRENQLIKGDDKVKLSNASIKDCTKKMRQQNSIKPIFDVWRDIKEYKSVDDESFLRDFIKIIFLIYKNWIKISSDTEISATTDDILELYDTLSSIPVADMLDRVDDLVGDVLDGLKKRKVKPKKLWRKIVYKFWWVPTLVMGGFMYWYMNKRKSEDSSDESIV